MGHAPHCLPPDKIFGECNWAYGIKNVVITFWFYVKTCIFQHNTDKIFPVSAFILFLPFLLPPTPPKVEMLEPPLNQSYDQVVPIERRYYCRRTPLIFLGRIWEDRILTIWVAKTPTYPVVCPFPHFVSLFDHSPPLLQTDRQTDRQQTDGRTDGRTSCS